MLLFLLSFTRQSFSLFSHLSASFLDFAKANCRKGRAVDGLPSFFIDLAHLKELYPWIDCCSDFNHATENLKWFYFLFRVRFSRFLWTVRKWHFYSVSFSEYCNHFTHMYFLRQSEFNGRLDVKMLILRIFL